MTVLSATILSGGAQAAPTIAYVGTQLNIDSDAVSETPADGWRTSSFDKPLDIDGDDIVGTDGWRLRSSTSNPTYATTTVVAPNGNGGPWGFWDNPANPSAADNLAAGVFHDNGQNTLGNTSANLLQFVLSGTDLVGKTLRLGVLYDVLGAGTGTFTLTQTVGGSATATTTTLTYDTLSLDVAYFDITGAVAGDTFVIKSTILTGSTVEQFAGITFDSAVVPSTPYEAWLAANSKTDTPENLREFAFGTTNTGALLLNGAGTAIVTKGQAPIITTTVGSAFVKLTYARLKNSECTFSAQYSDGLSNWLASNDSSLIYAPGAPAGETVVDNGDDMEIVSINFPVFRDTGSGFVKMEANFCRIAVTTN